MVLKRQIFWKGMWGFDPEVNWQNRSNIFKLMGSSLKNERKASYVTAVTSSNVQYFPLPMIFTRIFLWIISMCYIRTECITSLGNTCSKSSPEANVQNASVLSRIYSLVFLCTKWDGRRREGNFTHVKRSWFANMWKPLNAISERVGSQHASWAELCLKRLFLNEFKWKLWKTQNSRGEQWIQGFNSCHISPLPIDSTSAHILTISKE